MAWQIQQRRGTAADWTATNPVLAQGEIGYETDKNRMKLGDGTSTWTNLPYFTGSVGFAAVPLTDAPTITVDASLGNNFTVTLAGSRTMANPTNPLDGQRILFQVTQGTGGNFTLGWGTAYEFSSGLPTPVLSTTAGQTDLLGFIYNANKSKWLFMAYITGYN